MRCIALDAASNSDSKYVLPRLLREYEKNLFCDFPKKTIICTKTLISFIKLEFTKELERRLLHEIN